MLYRYSVENFKSFKERAELSMIPTEEGNSHILDQNSDIPILKTAIIYGANASGKSCLIKSIEFARNIIRNNKYFNTSNNPCFRLDDESIKKPTVFNFEFKLGEKLFQYGFSFLFSKGMILEEWLYDLVENTPWFERAYDFKKNKYTYNFSYNGLTTEDKNRLAVYQEDMTETKRELLLTVLGKKKFTSSTFGDQIKDIIEWFNNIIIIFPNSRFRLSNAVALDEEGINDLYKEYFKLFGIPIDNIHLEKVPIEMTGINKETLINDKSDILELIEKKNIRIMHNHKGKEYLLEFNHFGDLEAKEVRFCHKKNDQGYANFAIHEESDGTQRLFDLIPALARLIKHNGIFIIDEIDRSLHSLVTKHIIRCFLERSKGLNSQLICTTHEQLLLDITLLRKDEIWFVDKNEKEQSNLTPLSKYKTLFLDNLEKNYLLGRYQGIPKIVI